MIETAHLDFIDGGIPWIKNIGLSPTTSHLIWLTGDTDPNEFGKVVAFMRRYKGEDNAKDRLMDLVHRLANTQNALIRSSQTQEYYQNIQEACETHLHSISDTGEILTILGWSLRLMRYYCVEPERAVKEQHHPLVPQAPQQTLEMPHTQTPQPPKEPEKPKIKVGDRVKAGYSEERRV